MEYQPPNRIAEWRARFGMLFLLLAGWSSGLQGQAASSLPDMEGMGWIVLFVYPPSLPLRAESPAKMFRGTLRIELRRLLTPSRRVRFEEEDGTPGTLRSPYFSTIGHTIVWLHCPEDSGRNVEDWASLSAHDFAARGLQRLIRDGRGLGILLDPYPEAYLPGAVENPLRLLHYRGWRRGRRIAPRYLAIPVGAEACADVRAMVRAYREAAREPFPLEADADPQRGLVFSSVLDPHDLYLRRQAAGAGILGGGCAPFGIALLKGADAFHPHMDTLWNMVLDMPESLIGGDGRRVAVWRLLLGRPSRAWASEGQRSQRYVNADPQRIWDWIGAAPADGPGSLPGLRVQAGPVLRIMDPLPEDHRQARRGTLREVRGVILTRDDE